MATLIITNDKKYPFILEMGNGGKKSITPTMVDFDNCQAWHQRGQASENGEWIEFDDIQFRPFTDRQRLLIEMACAMKIAHFKTPQPIWDFGEAKCNDAINEFKEIIFLVKKAKVSP